MLDIYVTHQGHAPRKWTVGYSVKIKMPERLLAVWFSYLVAHFFFCSVRILTSLLKWRMLWWGWSHLLELSLLRSADPGRSFLLWALQEQPRSINLSGYIINTVPQSYQSNRAHPLWFPPGHRELTCPLFLGDTLTWKIPSFTEPDRLFSCSHFSWFV